eukprot:6199156-Pleurochrysis_carterae.AAC.2
MGARACVRASEHAYMRTRVHAYTQMRMCAFACMPMCARECVRASSSLRKQSQTRMRVLLCEVTRTQSPSHTHTRAHARTRNALACILTKLTIASDGVCAAVAAYAFSYVRRPRAFGCASAVPRRAQCSSRRDLRRRQDVSLTES